MLTQQVVAISFLMPALHHDVMVLSCLELILLGVMVLCIINTQSFHMPVFYPKTGIRCQSFFGAPIPNFNVL